MTVIAYKAGKMACDALCVDIDTGTTVSKGSKIKRTKVGALIGQSGDADSRAFLALMDTIKCGAKIPTCKELADTKCEGTFLIAFPTGEVWTIDIYPDKEMQAWQASACAVTGMHSIAHAGCGGELALAFMRAGKTAREAVASVCEINAYCAPPIYEEKLRPTIKPIPKLTTSPPNTASQSSKRKARK